MNPKKVAILIGASIVALFLIIALNSLFATNDMGWYQVKQAAITGKMSVRNQPGTYLQLFATVTPYQVSDIVYFSKYDEDGGKGTDSDPIKVRFNDGGTAEISGLIKFRLSRKEDEQLKLHEDFKSYEAVKLDLVRQTATEALIQTASIMKAEESYSTRRSEFTSFAEGQVKQGIWETEAEELKKEDVEGNDFIEKLVKVKYGKNGNPIIRKLSPFARYNIEILQFVIKDIDFDETIDALIAKKKEAEQQKVVAKANAERAKQDAITAREQGAANIAKAKAEEEVVKIKAVTQAQKAYEVAQFEAKKALEVAKKTEAEGRAEAAVAKAKVAAGLTPFEKATIDKETRIGVAEALAKVALPKMMVIGGDGKSGKVNPFDAVGLKAYMDIVDEASK